MSQVVQGIRQFVSQVTGAAASRPQVPRMLVVAGGRAGVGATTLTVNLAAALAQDALRTVLIDADLHQADAAAQCNLPAGLGIGDVLAGRKNIHEVLQRGPAGLQILAGAASAETRNSLSQRAIQRLLRQIATLGPHADWIIVDAGNQPSEFAAWLWTAAEIVLLVTVPEAAAVMESYALIKTLLARHELRRDILLAVNQAADDAVAADVHRRIDQSCRRFLGLPIEFAGGLPHGNVGRGLIDSASPLAAALARLGSRLFVDRADTRAAQAA
jgi:flagellar biosynthesis protein FlhG